LQGKREVQVETITSNELHSRYIWRRVIH